MKSITPGDMHYFADARDLEQLLVNFRVLSCEVDEGYWENDGVQQRYSNWIVLAEKDS